MPCLVNPMSRPVVPCLAKPAAPYRKAPVGVVTRREQPFSCGDVRDTSVTASMRGRKAYPLREYENEI